MSLSQSARAVLVSVCALSAMAIMATSASAAGLPEIEGISAVNTSIVNTKVEAEVNPEGAATTFKVEYRRVGETPFTSTPSQNVGSGTAWVLMTANLTLPPESTALYEIRVSATNSFGTTREFITKTFQTAKWSIEGGLESSTFTSVGTWELNFTFTGSGEKGKFKCTEFGSGSLGHPEATGDSYKISTSECSYYHNEKFVCNPKPGSFAFTANGLFQYKEGTEHFHFCASEEGALSSLQIGNYSVSMPKGSEFLKTQPITLTAEATINGGWHGTVTVSSNWSLPTGWKFKVA
jgi:hypothetical protein